MSFLYLFPLPLGNDEVEHLPHMNHRLMANLRYFIVEKTRTARRFIRKVVPEYSIDDATFIEIDKHDFENSSRTVANLLDGGKNVGLMSEAGLPCIADPGAVIVDMARTRGYTIRPLTGPSSIFLSLMASGFDGQHFSFNGYLPIKANELLKKTKDLERKVLVDHATQIFIETPYRNDKMIEYLCQNLHPKVRLCIAWQLTMAEERIETRYIREWKDFRIGKVPAIFLLGR